MELADAKQLQAAAFACVKSLVPRDGGSRSQVLARLQALGEWAVPGSRTSLFGSSACELHAHGADLDVTLLPDRTTAAPPTHAEQQALVRHLAVAFQPLLASGEFTQVEAIDRARVPILKLLHAESGLRCDLSIGNELAMQKTRLLHAYVLLDQRVRPLCLIIKHCAPPLPTRKSIRAAPTAAMSASPTAAMNAFVCCRGQQS